MRILHAFLGFPIKFWLLSLRFLLLLYVFIPEFLSALIQARQALAYNVGDRLGSLENRVLLDEIIHFFVFLFFFLFGLALAGDVC